jgi:hypothetical protein
MAKKLDVKSNTNKKDIDDFVKTLSSIDELNEFMRDLNKQLKDKNLKEVFFQSETKEN